MKPATSIALLLVGLLLGFLFGTPRTYKYSRAARSAEHRADSLLAIADSLRDVKVDHVKLAEEANTEVQHAAASDRAEVQRYHHERAQLDTAGAAGLKRIILWAGQH